MVQLALVHTLWDKAGQPKAHEPRASPVRVCFRGRAGSGSPHGARSPERREAHEMSCGNVRTEKGYLRNDLVTCMHPFHDICTYARVLPVLLCWQTVLTDSQKKRMGAMYMYSFVAVVDNNNTC